MDRDHIEAY